MLCCSLHNTEQGEAGKVDLVTADGSIDCQSDPARQESIVSDLHHCEAVAALRILAPGGSLVLKMFTLFESESVCLLYLLVSVFNEVDVFKPATSKEGNSEVYIVCRDLQPSNWLESVLAQVVQYFSMISTVIFTAFRASLREVPGEQFPVWTGGAAGLLHGRGDEVRGAFHAAAGERHQQQSSLLAGILPHTGSNSRVLDGTWDFQDPLNGADMKDLAEIQKQVSEPYCTLGSLHRCIV